jgi:hypothetical protein
MEPIFITAIVFGSFFGIVYLFFTTRHKERLSLIEKGADASLFNTGSKSTKNGWLKLLLNIGLMSMGIGIGVFLGGLMVMNGMEEEMAFPSMIFTCGGLGLVVGFFVTRKIDKEDNK